MDNNSQEGHDLSTVEQLRNLLGEKLALIDTMGKELVEARKTIGIRDREIDQLRSVLIQKNEYIEVEVEGREKPSERRKKRGVVGERLDLDNNFETPLAVEKDEASKRLIKEALIRNEFLRRLDNSEIDDIIKYMRQISIEADSYIIKEGQDGDAFYVSLEGTFEVWKGKTMLGTMDVGRAFGELALLYNCNRTASVKAISDCKLWKLDRKTFQNIMFTSNIRKQKEIISFLTTIPALKEISMKKMIKLADVVEEIDYKPNDYIIRENEVGNAFFIIKSGQVKVTQTNSEGIEEHVRNMTVGEWFGEKALYTLEKRSANIIAIDHVELFSLDRNNFIYLIGNLSEIRRKKYNDSNSSSSKDGLGDRNDEELSYICRSSKGSSYDETPNNYSPNYLSKPRQNESEKWVEDILRDELKTIGILGIGGFGRVELVQWSKDEDKIFALKCMKKDHIVRTKQQQHIIAERDIMIEIQCNFVCRLYKTFRDDKYVYMLIESCLGGELWTILRNRGNFDDNITRFVIACVLEAFTYLHLKGILYRDLKPENLLIEKSGYIKMCDFGFAKKVGVGNKTWTFCGTPEYVAPEIILNKGHDHSADYWSLGILMYELLTGSPPFTGVDPMKIYNVILRGIEAVDFPPTHISRNAGYLIKKLCVQSPVERLGYGRGGIVDIKQNKYFQGFDWIGLHRATLTSPLIPKIKSKTDLSNFDMFQFVNETPPDETSGWDNDF